MENEKTTMSNEWNSSTHNTIHINQKSFEILIEESEIKKRVDQLAQALFEEISTAQCSDLPPVFLGILNGSTIFLSDLVRCFSGECEFAFTKISSYQGTASTDPTTSLKITRSLENRVVVVVEDIIDTGKTLKFLVGELSKLNIQKLIIVSLLCKPSVFKNQYEIQHIGFNIPNRFVVGYGLDINELGRNLRHIYALKE